jgi:galactosamine-6-phosphate isomerase
MELIVEETYETMSAKAAEAVVHIVDSLEHPVLCTASGDSPAGLYKNLVKHVNDNATDISEWYFIGLDEWLNMNGGDEGSCRFHLNNQLFGPLRVQESNIAFFDGRATDTDKECNRIENFIKEKAGIDIAIVGLGMNGHVGMNEPGTSASLYSHVADLDSITQQVGQKYFKEKQSIAKGITLGIADLMEARRVLLIVSGAKKAAVVKQVLEGDISESVPASLLRHHKSLIVYLDNDAASLLEKK